MYWALLHAQYHSLRRIIIVLPYISIIDQTASILKDVFGEEVVLEHHSGVMEDDESYAKETFDRGLQSAKQLACENWDAPKRYRLNLVEYYVVAGHVTVAPRKGLRPRRGAWIAFTIMPNHVHLVLQLISVDPAVGRDLSRPRCDEQETPRAHRRAEARPTSEPSSQRNAIGSFTGLAPSGSMRAMTTSSTPPKNLNT